MLLTHHFRVVDEATGVLMGALADVQAQRVQELLREAGVSVDYRSFPTVGHSMHGTEPDLYVDTLLDWVATLDRERREDRRPRPLPPGLLPGRRCSEHGHDQPDGFPCIPEWSAEEHVAVMDRLGIATSLLSRLVARRALRRRRPRPRRERGRSAGRRRPPRPVRAARVAPAARRRRRHRRDRPLLRPPRRRRLRAAHQRRRHVRERPVVRSRSSASSTGAAHACSLHPTSPACWEHTSLGRPRPMLEFLFDTTRTVVDLVLNGTIARQPRPRAHRPARRRDAPAARRPRERVRRAARVPTSTCSRDLGRLHFDLAGHAVPRAARRAADDDDARPPPLRERLPVHARAGRRRGRRAPRRASTVALRANTERLFPTRGRT